MVMPEYSRISFRVPDRYSEILRLVVENDGLVGGTSPFDYDECFAMNVDEMVEVRFTSVDREAAEAIISRFLDRFDQDGITYAIVTSAKPEGVIARGGSAVAGTVYLNAVGYREAMERRELPGTFNPDDPTLLLLRRSGVTRTGLTMLFDAPVESNSAGPGL